MSDIFKRIVDLDAEVTAILRKAERKAEEIRRGVGKFEREILENLEREVDSKIEEERERRRKELKSLEDKLSLELLALERKIGEVDISEVVEACLKRVGERVCS